MSKIEKNVIDARTVTIAEARSRVMRCLRVQRPVFLWGPPGVGKTSLARSIAESLCAKTFLQIFDEGALPQCRQLQPWMAFTRLFELQIWLMRLR